MLPTRSFRKSCLVSHAASQSIENHARSCIVSSPRLHAVVIQKQTVNAQLTKEKVIGEVDLEGPSHHRNRPRGVSIAICLSVRRGSRSGPGEVVLVSLDRLVQGRDIHFVAFDNPWPFVGSSPGCSSFVRDVRALLASGGQFASCGVVPSAFRSPGSHAWERAMVST